MEKLSIEFKETDGSINPTIPSKKAQSNGMFQ
jgi:hypothetical protein